MEIVETIIRTLAAILIIMGVARMIGKQTISQMTYHDFVAAITVGAITANLAFNTALSFWAICVSLVIFGGVTLLMTILSLKSRKWRKWVSGKPTVLIENGKILENNLKRLKFNLDTLNQELREKNVFDIEEVEYAVLELNGRISVLKKPEYRHVTRKDLSIPNPARTSFPVEVIMDGKMIEENLEQNNLDKEWVLREIGKRHAAPESVFYAVRGSNGQLFLDLYRDGIEQPIDKE
jgi:uncharacterized membrane protein YcaP (DUF421 family)